MQKILVVQESEYVKDNYTHVPYTLAPYTNPDVYYTIMHAAY